MNNDMLSQDDIDNLIPDAGGDGTAAASVAISADALKVPLTVVAEQISTVLITVLGKEIKVTVKSVAPSDAKRLEPFAADAVLIKVDLLQGVNGPVYFVYSKKDVAVLADLMMMGDGSAAYEEDHKDAITELTNQIMGAVVSTFGTQFEEHVAMGSSSIEDFKPSAPVASNSQYAEMIMKIEDVKDATFGMLIPNEVAETLIKLSSKKAAAPAAGAKPEADGTAAAGGFDFGDLGGGSDAMPMQNFSQPTGHHLANDKSSQFTSTGNPQIDMLLDVTLQVAIELGRTNMSIKKILELGPGSIIELDRMAGEPVDLLVNDKVVAKGEVVVVDENFGIRIVKLISPEERLKNLR